MSAEARMIGPGDARAGRFVSEEIEERLLTLLEGAEWPTDRANDALRYADELARRGWPADLDLADAVWFYGGRLRLSLGSLEVSVDRGGAAVFTVDAHDEDFYRGLLDAAIGEPREGEEPGGAEWRRLNPEVQPRVERSPHGPDNQRT